MKEEQSTKTMKCVMLTGPKTIEVKQVPIPKPSSGEVLIKVMAAPINPSDLEFYNGNYETQKKFPAIMGFEGSGIVVQNGGGMMGWGIVGKKVAFAVETQGLGSYSEYTVVKASECLPLPNDVSFEQGCMSLVNPLTVLGFLDILKQKNEKSVLITAAASALGRIINRLFPAEGIEVINIIRRAEQAEVLKSEGAKIILNSSEEGFEEQLRETTLKYNCLTCFQAIGGKITGLILRSMPKNSTVTVYGLLSHEDINDIDTKSLLFENKTINSFMLTTWLRGKSQWSLYSIIYKVRRSIANSLKSEISKKFKIDQVEEAIKFYLENMTAGKVILEPLQD